MAVSALLARVDGGDFHGAVNLGFGDVVADLERALEVGELATHGGDTHVLDGEASRGVLGIDGPRAGRYDGGNRGDGCHWVSSMSVLLALASLLGQT